MIRAITTGLLFAAPAVALVVSGRSGILDALLLVAVVAAALLLVAAAREFVALHRRR